MRLVVGAVALGAAMTVALVAALMLSRDGTPRTGSVVVNATPWGTVTSISSESGETVPLPAENSTPASLTLPAGSYRVTLTGPPPDSRLEQVTVKVEAGRTAQTAPIRFGTMSPDEYFEPYLSTPAAGRAR